jgi:hypothetical protein
MAVQCYTDRQIEYNLDLDAYRAQSPCIYDFDLLAFISTINMKISNSIFTAPANKVRA